MCTINKHKFHLIDKYIGIDPGHYTGLAVYTSKSAITTAEFRLEDMDGIRELVGYVEDIITDKTHVVIEDTWITPDKNEWYDNDENWRDNLHRLRLLMDNEFGDRGIDVYYSPPGYKNYVDKIGFSEDCSKFTTNESDALKHAYNCANYGKRNKYMVYTGNTEYAISAARVGSEFKTQGEEIIYTRDKLGLYEPGHTVHLPKSYRRNR